MALTLTHDLVTGFKQAHEPTEDNVHSVAVTVSLVTNNLGSGETLAAIIHPANSRLLHLYHSVQTAEGAALTYDIGDADDDDKYLAAADGNSTATQGILHPAFDPVTTQGLITLTSNTASADAMVLYIEATFSKTVNS